MSKKYFDLVFLLVIVLVSAFLVVSLKLRLFETTFLYFILPSVYLCLRKAKNYKKIFIASFLFGFIFSFIFDLLGTLNGAWIVHSLTFPYKIFGLVPVDDMVWFFSFVFFTVVFYEHFLDDEKKKRVSKKLKLALLPSLFVFLGVVFLLFIKPEYLNIAYSYFWLGLAGTIPLIYILCSHPEIIHKFIKLNLFFVFINSLFEVTALLNGQWSFPGQYIGNIDFFGLKLAFEEFLFYIVLSGPALIAYYEIYVDDEV